MVKTGKHVGFAVFVTNDLGGAMATGVVKCVDPTLSVSTYDYRLAGDVTRDVISRPRNLAFMANEIPDAIKYFFLFLTKHLIVRVNAIINEILIGQVRFDNLHSHESSPGMVV
jgi:hypothetical protein